MAWQSGWTQFGNGWRSKSALSMSVATAAADEPVAGMTLWLDADDQTTITMSGSNVTEWRDKSGNSNDFISGSFGATPTTGTFNGLGSILFRPFTGDHLRSPVATLDDVITVSACTIFAVFKTTQIDGPPPTYDCIFSDVNEVFFVVVDDTTGTTAGIVNSDAASNFDNAFADTTGFSDTGVALKVQHTGGNIKAGIGNAAYSATTGSGDTTGATTGMRIGKGRSGATFKGHVGELIIYNTALSDADTETTMTYLLNKWSLS